MSVYAKAKMIGFLNEAAGVNGVRGRQAIVECGGQILLLRDENEGETDGFFGNPSPHIGEDGFLDGALAFVKIHQDDSGEVHTKAQLFGLEGRSHDPVPLHFNATDVFVEENRARAAIIMATPAAIVYWTGVDILNHLNRESGTEDAWAYPETPEEAQGFLDIVSGIEDSISDAMCEAGNEVLDTTRDEWEMDGKEIEVRGPNQTQGQWA